MFWQVRAAPAHMLRLQGGRFDAPDRLFCSVREAWLGVTSANPADVKELIPEFFLRWGVGLDGGRGTGECVRGCPSSVFFASLTINQMPAHLPLLLPSPPLHAGTTFCATSAAWRWARDKTGAPWATWSCRPGPPAAPPTSWGCTGRRWRLPTSPQTCTTG